MKLKSLIFLISIIFLMVCCTSKTVRIKNNKKGQLQVIKTLKLAETKKILLDSNTAPSPQYTQMFKGISDIDYFTFLNTYTNSIYFYNYNTLKYVKQVAFEKKGPNGILKPTGYHIKTMDSIYVYNIPFIELVLTNGIGEIINRKSLIRNKNIRSPWYFKYPQYYTRTAAPFIETKDKLILTGQFMFSVPDTIIDNFKFSAYVDYNTLAIDFNNGYPKELYGYNYNWNDQIFTDVFSELHSDGEKLIYSFPISHDLYITNLNKNTYQKKYAGSNNANTISSISKKQAKMTREELGRIIKRQDLYASIKYDKYRKVYYRVIRRAIPNATIHTNWKEKNIGIIIMDKDFNYLGETTLGFWKEWNWNNMFVTEEGLNIEYLDNDDIDEVALTLKIFTLQNL